MRDVKLVFQLSLHLSPLRLGLLSGACGLSMGKSITLDFEIDEYTTYKLGDTLASYAFDDLEIAVDGIFETRKRLGLEQKDLRMKVFLL